MKDIINSFKAHLYERTSSPLIGTFIFYWIICNYKLIMIIFDGEMKLNEKFDLMHTPEQFGQPADLHPDTLPELIRTAS
uniref:hypothetical protein n=1 Tax=Aliarcobacter butzleri TaxID=28197 RepID=UPI001D026045